MPHRTDRRSSGEGETLWRIADFSPAQAPPPPRRELSLGASSQLHIGGVRKPRSQHCRRKRSPKGLSELAQKLRAVLGISQENLDTPDDTSAHPTQGLHLLESMLEQGPASQDEMDAIQLLLNISCTAQLSEKNTSRRVNGLVDAACQREKLRDTRVWQDGGWTFPRLPEQTNGHTHDQTHRSRNRKHRKSHSPGKHWLQGTQLLKPAGHAPQLQILPGLSL